MSSQNAIGEREERGTRLQHVRQAQGLGARENDTRGYILNRGKDRIIGF